MSVSIYYTCKRAQPLTVTEQATSVAIIERYNTNFQWQEIAESFCVYENPTADTIFEGATKLPFVDDYELIEATLAYWLACLTEIRQQISGNWQVHVDDIDVVWQDQRWQMPI